jgi:hypothetical protein
VTDRPIELDGPRAVADEAVPDAVPIELDGPRAEAVPAIHDQRPIELGAPPRDPASGIDRAVTTESPWTRVDYSFIEQRVAGSLLRPSWSTVDFETAWLAWRAVLPRPQGQLDTTTPFDGDAPSASAAAASGVAPGDLPLSPRLRALVERMDRDGPAVSRRSAPAYQAQVPSASPTVSLVAAVVRQLRLERAFESRGLRLDVSVEPSAVSDEVLIRLSVRRDRRRLAERVQTISSEAIYARHEIHALVEYECERAVRELDRQLESLPAAPVQEIVERLARRERFGDVRFFVGVATEPGAPVTVLAMGPSGRTSSFDVGRGQVGEGEALIHRAMDRAANQVTRHIARVRSDGF